MQNSLGMRGPQDHVALLTPEEPEHTLDRISFLEKPQPTHCVCGDGQAEQTSERQNTEKKKVHRKLLRRK
jgi:hypothetical protein